MQRCGSGLQLPSSNCIKGDLAYCIIVQLVYELSARPLACYFPTYWSACSDHMRNLLALFQRLLGFTRLRHWRSYCSPGCSRGCPRLPAEADELVHHRICTLHLDVTAFSMVVSVKRDAAGYEKSDELLLVRMLERIYDT